VKIKLDENLPAELVGALASLGHDVHSTPMELLEGQPDPQIWAVAQTEERFLITQDLDFSDIRSFAPGTHHGLLLVRLSNPSRRALVARLKTVFATEDVPSWSRCFVVATDRKVRVRRP
jgi:predicted nuclease of predicted toxin-antitoxin system